MLLFIEMAFPSFANPKMAWWCVRDDAAACVHPKVFRSCEKFKAFCKQELGLCDAGWGLVLRVI